MKKVNWGIIGLGSIAIKFADGFKNSKNGKLIAISSKNSNKLKKFKEQFKINENYCFDDYKNLLKCNDLDIIYIALPNSLHHEWIIECIKNNKKYHGKAIGPENCNLLPSSCFSVKVPTLFRSPRGKSKLI